MDEVSEDGPVSLRGLGEVGLKELAHTAKVGAVAVEVGADKEGAVVGKYAMAGLHGAYCNAVRRLGLSRIMEQCSGQSFALLEPGLGSGRLAGRNRA